MGRGQDAAKLSGQPPNQTHMPKIICPEKVSGVEVERPRHTMKSCVFLGTYQIYRKVSHPCFKFRFQDLVLGKASNFSASILQVCKMGMILCHMFLFSLSSSLRAANECLPSTLKILITVIPSLSVQGCRAPGSPADRIPSEGARPVTAVPAYPSRRPVSSP